MLLLIKVLLVYGVLAGLLWLLALFLHNYLYTQQPSGLAWRAPLAAAIVVSVCLGFPALMSFGTGRAVPMTLGQFFLDTTPLKVLEFSQLEVTEGGRTVVYRREGGGVGPNNFVAPDRRRFPREVSQFMAHTREGEKIRFHALRDAQGSYVQGTGGPVYESEQGYRMEAAELGRIEITPPGTLPLNLLVMVTGLCSWIGAFLLLQFNLGHALGLGSGLYFAWLFGLGFIF
ncbi:MAG: hypothetical protein RMJ19_06335 [Gemmatales bacterium]|nr:hypothetical protein [Gemmatales bacterium]MCS7160072.1 hypothetical protein [Gemmatales bacterium]MDW8175272.1 hypothetical protein [Gemmatales bacterium]